jgi:DNA-binding MarR family transcriptional regulator
MNMVAEIVLSAPEMQQQDTGRSRAMLYLLESIDREGEQSQRTMATQFGVALGLVNTYLKICVKKGYIKVKRLPSRRYVYLLTPKGMVEKLRLTVMLLSNELERFRCARADYANVFAEAQKRGWRCVALIGVSELAEISAICAFETSVEIIGLVDPDMQAERYIGLPVVMALSDMTVQFDGAIITNMQDAQAAFYSAVAALGEDRVLAPAFFDFSVTRGRAS